MPTTITDHGAAQLSIYQMVLNRLPFLVDSVGNEQKISYFTFEIMSQLNICFQLANADIGKEEKYSTLQKSIIADLDSLYILITQAAIAAGGTAGSGASNGKFLKRVKADVVESEWEQFDVTKGITFAISPTQMQDFFKKQAITKAASLGCLLDVTDDALVAYIQSMSTPKPFITFQSSGCDGCGS